MSALQDNVHIIPLGHEYDRAIAPFRKRSADRVYILSISDAGNYPAKMIERQKHFIKKVLGFFEERKIKVIFREVNLFDLLDVMTHVSSIIDAEHGNNISVNMSACGRLTSIGTTLAAMAKGVSVYYVRAENYSLDVKNFMDHGLSISTNSLPFKFENFQFVLPDPVSKMILVELYRNNRGMTTHEIKKLLFMAGVSGFDIDPDNIPKALKYAERRLEATKQFMKLEKRYLEKLEQSGYIQRVKVGRENITSITESGKYIACISGMNDCSPGIEPASCSDL